MTPKVVGSAWMPWLRPMVTVLVLEGAALQGRQQPIHIGDENVGGALQLDVEAGIQHVGRRHALVHEARLRPDDFRKMREKRDDVMLGLGLDGVDAGDIEDAPCRPCPRCSWPPLSG